MMLQNVDNIPAYERMHLLTFKQDVENSHHLNKGKKGVYSEETLRKMSESKKGEKAP